MWQEWASVLFLILQGKLSAFQLTLILAMGLLYTSFIMLTVSSVAQSYPTLWPHGLQLARLPCPAPTPRAYSNSVHWVGDAIQPSHSLLFPSPPAFNLSQHQGLFQWVSSSYHWPKYWSFSFSIGPPNEYSGLISFRIDWFDLLAVQGTLKRTPMLTVHSLYTHFC